MNRYINEMDIFVGIVAFMVFAAICLACALWYGLGNNSGRVERPKRWRDM